MIDYSREDWLYDGERVEQRDRTWADLKRFFGPPFLTLWLGGGLLFALALWRGGLGGLGHCAPPKGPPMRPARRWRSRHARG